MNTPARSAIRHSVLSFTIAAAVAVPMAFSAAPASALPTDAGPIFCPPAIQKIGAAVNHTVDDPDLGSFDVGVTAGSLPAGVSLVKKTGLGTDYEGTPTALGNFEFTLKLTDRSGRSNSTTCFVDVVPADSRTERIGGADRYEEAVLIAHEVAPGFKAPLLYVASGEKYADALSASAIAAQHKAPLLLASRDGLPGRVAHTVSQFKPAEIVVIGSESTLSATVVTALQNAAPGATITRIGGVDRYATSRALIADTKFGAAASTSLFVASGTVFPDALSASPAAATIPSPVLLVNGSETALTTDEKTLLTSRGVKSATVFGGSDTLSSGIEGDLEAVAGAVTRIDGFDRFIVSANTVAKFFPAAVPSDTVYFATGANFPDALAGGVLAGTKQAPILLVQKSCMATEVAAQVTRLNPKRIVLLGGPNSLDTTLGNLPVCK